MDLIFEVTDIFTIPCYVSCIIIVPRSANGAGRQSGRFLPNAQGEGGTFLQSPLRLPSGVSVFGSTSWMPASWHFCQKAKFVFAGLVTRLSCLSSSPVHRVTSKRPDSAPQPGGSIAPCLSVVEVAWYVPHPRIRDTTVGFTVQTLWGIGGCRRYEYLQIYGMLVSGLHRGHQLCHRAR